MYNPVTRTITFRTNHFSVFFVSEWISPFGDVARSDWFYRAVRFAYSGGLMTGTSADAFAPNTNLTRAMLVTILHRYAGEPNSPLSSLLSPLFTDVAEGTWYTDAVAWASANGIVEGVGDNRFDPDAVITREQLAVILYRYASVAQLSVVSGQWSVDGGYGQVDLGSYTDGGLTSGWAADAVRWAVAQGIITGVSDTSIAPQGSATRAQTATMLQRFDDVIAR